MSTLKIFSIPFDIAWENPNQNQLRLNEMLQSLEPDVDLIVLPEMFSTGFTVNKQAAEQMHGVTMQWMQKKAGELDVAIVGSLFIKENDSYFNRAIFMQPDGIFYTYDKHHLFIGSPEAQVLTAGQTKTIVQWKGWRIALFICFDLRFPLWSWNVSEDYQYDYDLAIYMANWPAVREHHYQVLLKARAIENRCYVLGVNRAGTDTNNISYIGLSSLYNFNGDVINDNKILLKKQVLEEYRKALFKK